MAGYGWNPDLVEHREAASKYGMSRGRTMPRECKDMMREDVTLIRDQGDSQACVGFTFTSAAYTRLRYLGFDPPLFSPQALYGITRQLARTSVRQPLVDDGSFPYLAGYAFKQHGLATERVCPFDIATINDEIDVDVFQSASQFRVSDASRIDSGSDQDDHQTVLTTLLDGVPVPIGMNVGTNFEKYTKGRGPVDVEHDSLGRHMTYLVGFEDYGEVLIGANSWSSDYGDRGFYRITKQKFFSSSDRYAFTIVRARK